MILVQLDHIAQSFGPADVLVDVTWRIDDGTRIGLIGPNGCGKTTLARIITGEWQPTSGTVVRAPDRAIGYLKQEAAAPAGHSVRSYVLEADRTLVELHERIVRLEGRIADGGASESDLATYGSLRDRYHHLGGYEYESRCDMVLDRLGFRRDDFDRPVEVLSGGQQSRLELAALLIRNPDLLVLDEPTNHLDIEATEWLEGFLSSYRGAVIVISHDRVFLDRTVREIAEVEAGRLALYGGNYTAYVAERERRREQEERAYEQQRELIDRTEDFIRRNIAGQKTKQAQARRKQLARLQRLSPPARRKSVSLSFVASHRGANEVVEVSHLAKSYGSLRLFDDLGFLVRRGERVGVVGPNGSGKSTLLKTIVGEVSPDSGTVRFGTGIDAGYFDQRREGLDANNRVIDEVWSVKPALTTEEIRSFLGAFRFSEDEQFRIVGTLSGGEQSRVALAKLVLARVNLLILDEPTNHLDIPSRLALEEALANYPGTIVVVSHDRAFLRRLTTRIVRIEGGGAQVFEGSYGAYEAWHAERLAKATAETKPLPSNSGTRAKPDATTPSVPTDKAARIEAYEQKKETDKRRRKRERRFAEIEDEIMSIENRLLEIDDELANPEDAADWQHLRDLSAEREESRARLDALYEDWAAMEKSSSAGLGE